jgi:hypothetical protein
MAVDEFEATAASGCCLTDLGGGRFFELLPGVVSGLALEPI